MRTILCVGGVFNDEGGRPSGYFKKLLNALAEDSPDTMLVIYNGGFFKDIENILDNVPYFEGIIWAADVPNDKPKLVSELKVVNPKAMLVITKNNRQGKYNRMHLTARALTAKANLLIEFTESSEGKVLASLIDPLGNSFIEDAQDIDLFGKTLSQRLRFLSVMTRVGSEQVGALPEVFHDTLELSLFFSLVRDYASTFHRLIHLNDNGRMLGNLSFRCELGFPSVRWGNHMMVSRRNVDKRSIGIESMVPVELSTTGKVNYLGEAKPSVDTPIQRLLYCRWPKAMYMLHAHVHIAGAPFTRTVIPCGAIEEADEVLAVLPEYDGLKAAYINLVGHGSLAIASHPSMLLNIPYTPRSLY